MAVYPTFPDLSRRPALKTKTSTDDPTIRDTMENGMVATRARFTRRRRKWAVTIDMLTNHDVNVLERFVQTQAVYGAKIFWYLDARDAYNPTQLQVRFSKLPDYTDAGWVVSEFRQNCTFEIQEV